MMRSLNTAASGMVAQQRNLDTIANNLANVNTNGFKSQRAEFQDMVYQNVRPSGGVSGGVQQPSGMQIGLGTQFSATTGEFRQGSFQNTNNPMDLAIGGEGFFAVELPDGTRAYTRDGSFKTNSSGELVTSDGFKLADGITIQTGASALSISKNGTVQAKYPGQNEAVTVGQIKITVFPNPAGLTRLGQNLYAEGGASGTGEEKEAGAEGAGGIQQGYLEGSNVEIVEEMVKMITAQRAYEINSKAVQTSDDMLSVLNNLKR
ncbi:MAG: flagellar basal-body rod protein FlgG [Fimbriimonadaceae bacterium]